MAFQAGRAGSGGDVGAVDQVFAFEITGDDVGAEIVILVAGDAAAA